MAEGIMNFFKVVLIVQLFYSFAITGITYAMPDDAKQFVTGFSDVSERIGLETTSGKVLESLNLQKNIPVIELGALVFYSGNVVIDLLVNFAFATPEMLGMLINSIMMLVGIDSYLFALVQVFATVVVTVLYVLGLIQLITNQRSGQAIA